MDAPRQTCMWEELHEQCCLKGPKHNKSPKRKEPCAGDEEKTPREDDHKTVCECRGDTFVGRQGKLKSTQLLLGRWPSSLRHKGRNERSLQARGDREETSVSRSMHVSLHHGLQGTLFLENVNIVSSHRRETRTPFCPGK